MGFFDRLRSGARGRKESPSSTAVTPERDALRLIDEGNAIEDEGRFQDALARYEAAIHLAPNLARAHLNRGNALLALGDADGAAGAYATALVQDPVYAAAHYNMGNALVRSNRRAAALAAYRRALELKPDFADAEVALGALFEDLGQPDDAVASYRRALQINPACAAVHGNLGNVLQDLGQFGEAAASYRRALGLDPQLVMLHYGLGNALQRLGQHEDAAASYRRVLQTDPHLALAHFNLGNAQRVLGQNDEAIASFRCALQTAPDLAIAHYNLGNTLNDLGQTQEAVASYREALRLDGHYVNAHFMLGNLLMKEGQLPDALACYKGMLEIEPQNFLAHNNMGSVLMQQGKRDEAADCFRRAIELAPDYVDAQINLGATFHERGELDDAAACYQKALSLSPDSSVVHFKLGNIVFEQRKLDEAIACYRKALELKPDFPEAYSNLGNVLVDQGQWDEAAACYRKALQIKPDFPEAHNNLGEVFKSKGLLDEAIACYKEAIELKPEFPEAHVHLGNVLLDQDRVREARDCYQEALRLRPEYAEARWSFVASQIPAVYEADNDPGPCRTVFSQELDKLDNWFDAARTEKNFNSVRIQTPFYLAYQEEDNRDILRRHGRLCARIMAQWLARQVIANSGSRDPDGVIRIGIVSAHFRTHSVWNAILRGWFQHLDSERFSLHAFYLGSDQDQETLFAKSRAAHFEEGGRELRQWIEAIAGQQPDVLVYPEIGMESMTGRLASLRLAPVQVATWGHPVTTGLPTIDYYLSAENLEPDRAREHYTELLVTLPRLGCFYEPQKIAAAQPDLGNLGIDPKSPLLLCPGVPYKYAPQHDWVLAEIARRLGRCQFVFFTHGASPNMSEKLRRRLEVEFGRNRLDLDEFAIFIPWQEPPGFFGLLERADVFLDTIGFSGFNTAMQAVECALPIVTREGRFLRGRLASGILKQIGLHELVAQSEEDYITLAVKLVRDAEYREHIGERMEASRRVLFEDRAPIRALEEFFVRATMEAKNRGGLWGGLA